MRNKAYAVVLCVALGLIAALAVSCREGGGTAGDTPNLNVIGKPAPDFALPDLSGKTVRLSDFKGKVVLVDFWATWCPPCRKGIPEFIELQRRFEDKGFTTVGVALDQQGAAVVKPFAENFGINYPVVIGGDEVSMAYGGIQAIPTTFLIGRDGSILKSYVGYHPQSEFERAIQAALQ
jgi:cytochrome c biogenesis protein CcmG/thiol:disulfide interchange protein DsbE